MSGHLGRIGGRQVVAVLALGGGLLLGPVLPGAPAGRAAEDGTSGTGDTGPAATAPDTARAGLAASGSTAPGLAASGSTAPGLAASGSTAPGLTAPGLEPVRHRPGPFPGAGRRFRGAG
ncbi:hypothetical protein GCM10010508_68140 [Streptomyces naganishii JCM 4654]|uniref:Uncharacterized protein n=1 Tax=Streptomyces naganishii JCM 4654 TaxID=1306179 RepID=A0A918YAW0_9ACTN|nr:hypothetical protein GCM10010508_68140 [Streptomyces naganishii JCM 4654]